MSRSELYSEFDEESYLSRKRSERWQAWGFLLLGGLILLDSGSPVPFPLVGLPSLLLGGVLFAYGWMQARSYRRLPLREALQLGRQSGRLTRTEIFLKLHLTPEQTDELLNQLVCDGFIEPISDELPDETETAYRVIS